MAAIAPQTSFADGFFRSALDLSPSDMRRIYAAVDKFRADPEHPSLQFKKLRAEKTGRLHSIRAADDLRILIWREGSTFVFLEAGTRQHIYDRVGDGRAVINPSTGFVGVVPDPRSRGVDQLPPVVRFAHGVVDERPGVFDHWGDSDLAEAGFGAEAVAALRGCRSEDELLSLELSDNELDQAIELMELTPEQWRMPALLAADDAGEDRLRKAIADFGAAHGLSPFFTPDEVARIAAAPIEEWMIFLHPDQRAVVKRRFEGPARIRGAAGTGKTVVGLHRAAELANRFEEEDPEAPPILFTTYITTLPPIFEGLYGRLPNAKVGAVEFVNVDRLARRVAREAGRSPQVDTRAIDAAFSSAHRQVVTDGSVLGRANVTSTYLKDEVTKVIKGRGLATLDQYLAIERTGRTMPFNEAMRRQVWDLMVAWDEEMQKRGTIDFADVLLLARDAARARPGPTYRAAIIDEAQDLTLVGLQFVRALVNGSGGDTPDGLLLVGDGAQRIYPGCFTLRQAGIEVSGRSTILRTNYRNTAEILGAAMAVAGDQPVDDLGDEYRRGEAEATSIRAAGTRPLLVECASPQDEQRYLMDRINEIVADGSVGYGDIGIFVPTNKEVSSLIGLLGRAGIPKVDLNKFDGTPTDEVKVGTYFRAKGLEFKVVFLPGLDERFPRPPAQGQDAAEYEEARNLSIGQLFVAMTRARDALVITTPGSPSPVLVEHLDAFEVVET